MDNDKLAALGEKHGLIFKCSDGTIMAMGQEDADLSEEFYSFCKAVIEEAVK